MRHRITVTAEDAKGPMGDGTDCPVARALKRKFNAKSAEVGFDTCRVVLQTGVKLYFDTSKNLRNAIYDATESEVPFPFETGSYEVVDQEKGVSR